MHNIPLRAIQSVECCAFLFRKHVLTFRYRSQKNFLHTQQSESGKWKVTPQTIGGRKAKRSLTLPARCGLCRVQETHQPGPRITFFGWFQKRRAAARGLVVTLPFCFSFKMLRISDFNSFRAPMFGIWYYLCKQQCGWVCGKRIPVGVANPLLDFDQRMRNHLFATLCRVRRISVDALLEHKSVSDKTFAVSLSNLNIAIFYWKDLC